MGKIKFFLSSVGWLLLFYLGQLIGGIAYIVYLSISDPELWEVLSAAEDSGPLATKMSNPMLIGGAIFIFIAVLIKISAINNPNKTWIHKAKDYLNLKPIEKGFDYVRYFCIGITLNVIISSALSALYKLMDIEDSVSSGFEGSMLTLVCISFIVPLLEEILFRNRMYNALKNLCPRLANVLQALAFGFSHGNIIQGTYTFIFAIIFAKINDREKSLLPSIFIHCGINFYAGISLISPGSEIYLIPFVIFALPKIAELMTKKKNTLQ